MKKNRYSKALKVLKSNEIDEKIKRLNEQPTNNTKGVYSLNDPGFRLGIPDPPKVYYPDVDGNWPAGIPGTPGELTYTRPEGYWSGGSDWETQSSTDFSQDYLSNDPTGKSTAGLISDNGTVLAQLPPGGENFILGPIVDGYVYNHGYDDYTNIGYLQKDTRQFVLLARIQGHWSSSIKPSGFTPRQWGGTSTGFTAYNANFTLEMAQWVRTEILANKYSPNVPYFYSGGIPQIPQSAADCPNCPPGMFGGNGVGGRPFGKGGNPNIGTKQADPKKGNAADANLYGVDAKGKKKKLSAADYAAYKAGGGDAATKKGKSIEDVIAQGKKNIGKYDGGSAKPTAQQPKLDKWGRQIGTPLPPGVKQDMLKGGKTQSPVGDAAIVGATALAAGLGLKGVQAGANLLSKGKPLPVGPQTPTPPGYKGPFKPGSLTGKDLQGKPLPVGPQNPTPPGYKGPFKPGSLTGKDLQGNPLNTQIQQINQLGGKGTGNFTAAKGTGAPRPPKITNTSKEIWNTKTGKYETVTNKDGLKWDWAQRTISDPAFKHYQKTGEMPPGIKNWNPFKAFTPSMMQTGPTPMAGAAVKGLSSAGAAAVGLDAGAAKGQVSQDIINKGNTNPDSLTNKELDAYINYLKTQSPSQSSGAKPQSFDTLNKISPEPAGVDNLINKLTNSKPGSSKESTLKKDAVKMLDKLDPSSPKYNQLLNILSGPKGLKESFVISESRQRILREIKKPIIVEEQPQKLKNYRPNFAGRFTPQNTPDVTASKHSDEMVKAKNAAGQTWRTNDKYWKGYETVERMNIIYDNVGHGSQYWDMIVNENQNKKIKRDREIQEQLNIIAHEKAMIRENPLYESPFKTALKEQETLQADKDPLFKKVSKRLKKEIDYSDKPSKKGYPNDPPPEMIDGWHPEYGQKDPYYNKLDPHSADSMPPTGNPKIDANVEKAKRIKKIIKGT